MKTLSLCAALVVLSSCGGSGTLSLTTWGEDYIEQQIPSSSFEDGYSVKYSKFIVVIKDFTLATKSGTTGPSQDTPSAIDVTRAGPTVIQTIDPVDAIKWDSVSYGIGPATNAVAIGQTSAADVTVMNAEGKSIWVEGTVSKGAVSKTFSWKFDVNTHYANCTTPDLGEGVTIVTGKTEAVQLTIHGDHLWYDDLQSVNAKVRGQAITGADTDNDGVITQAELAAVALTTLPLGEYGTGGASNVKTLDDFVRALSRTVGHYRGEGECEATAR